MKKSPIYRTGNKEKNLSIIKKIAVFILRFFKLLKGTVHRYRFW
jgi:hypothetical protein